MASARTFVAALAALFTALGRVFATADSPVGAPSNMVLPGWQETATATATSLSSVDAGLKESLHDFFKKLHFNGVLMSHESQLLSAQTEVMRSQEEQESLNRRLRSGQFTSGFLYDYASQSTKQTNAVLNSTSAAMKPYLPVLQRSVANFLIASYLNSVTNGANLYNAYIGGHKDLIDENNKNIIKNMTSSYNDLVSMSLFASLDAQLLQKVNQHISSFFHL